MAENHAVSCQLRRCEDRFNEIDSGEELEELAPAMRRWAEENNLVPNKGGTFDYCTCGLKSD